MFNKDLHPCLQSVLPVIGNAWNVLNVLWYPLLAALSCTFLNPLDSNFSDCKDKFIEESSILFSIKI